LNRKSNIGSNRSFGIIFSIIFLIVSLWPILDKENIRIWSLLLSIVFLVLGTLNSKILTPLNNSWYKLGIFLGKVISPIVMAVIFFGVITPIGLLMKILKKDLLNLKFNNDKSYWIKKNEPKSKMNKQF
tara:strand:+ start:999 stop:1385 length:387 start_codon:yes stop_codon:yes gene_type:complete